LSETERLQKYNQPFGAKRRADLERHVKMDELVKLRLRGLTAKQCGEKLGVSYRTIEEWMKRSEWKARFLKTKAETFAKLAPSEELDRDQMKGRADIINVELLLKDLIAESSLKAVRQILEVMENKETPLALKLKAAIDLADRGPHSQKTKKVQQTSVGLLLTPQALAHASATAREILEFNHPIDAVDIDASDLTDDEDES
jgi:predicted DNA-binding protein (UPF0251 family)